MHKQLYNLLREQRQRANGIIAVPEQTWQQILALYHQCQACGGSLPA